MTQTKASPAVREEVCRLLAIVLSGLSADAMARISRMSLPAVEAALADLEAVGAIASGPVVLRGSRPEPAWMGARTERIGS